MKLELVIYSTSKFAPPKDKLLFCLPLELVLWDRTLANQTVAFTWQLNLHLLLLSPACLLPALHLCSCMASQIGGTNFLQQVAL